MLAVRLLAVIWFGASSAHNLECDTRAEQLEAQLSSARAALADLRTVVEHLTTAREQEVDADGATRQRQLTSASAGEIKFDGTQFVISADLTVNGTLTADTCQCVPSPTTSPTTAVPTAVPTPAPSLEPTPAWYQNVPTITASSSCTAAGGSGYAYCSGDDFHYCCTACAGARACSSDSGLLYCACSI